ncbi:hypothetical protein DAEQUDRAFT_769625 [Daedalea quercina L-15889]|uniref:Uncharacterized protein n=1 Tax=Daedalea quercina L-15889 TaxID=1314783 RepID=A0A165LJM3_9APHY|nr:hypothetical protein DAEQUDRAFT_769625 [Daedalea quercina L-15889]
MPAHEQRALLTELHNCKVRTPFAISVDRPTNGASCLVDSCSPNAFPHLDITDIIP